MESIAKASGLLKRAWKPGLYVLLAMLQFFTGVRPAAHFFGAAFLCFAWVEAFDRPQVSSSLSPAEIYQARMRGEWRLSRRARLVFYIAIGMVCYGFYLLWFR